MSNQGASGRRERATTPPEDARGLVGRGIERREDPALITGDAEYADDIREPGAAHLAVARSQYGHAEIESVDTSEAAAMDGVLAVYTAADLDAAGVGPLPTDDVEFAVVPQRPVLARERARFQGEAIAAVVAADRYTAGEAADRIDVEYDRLDAVTDPAAPDGPAIHGDAPDNVAFEWELGDAGAVADAFDGADATAEVELVNNRVAPSPMEPRAVVARYRPSAGKLSVNLSTQNAHTARRHLVSSLGLRESKVRVRPPDVGGGFGAKLQPYSAYVLAAHAAMDCGRPVKWQATRSEGFASTIHARDQITRAEAALSAAGDLLGLRVHTTANLGAYLGYHAAALATGGYGKMLPGQYDPPALHLSVEGVFTNTTPMSSYRGAGRPEAAYVIERIARAAARELDMDPADLRRRNFVEEFPHETTTGHVYDSGAYGEALDAALSAVGYDDFRERQAEAREEGRYLGVGLSCYVDAVGGSPGDAESALVRVKPSGRVLAHSGTVENGQGHRTAYAQIVADRLGVDYDDVEVIEGDTASVPEGHGTGGSRSMPVGGSSLAESAEKVIEQARRVAAHHLEADPEDLTFEDGAFRVRGAPDRSMELAEVAAEAYDGNVPEGAEAGLEATTFYDPSTYTFPFGAHVAVVEVDPDSGEIEFEDYVAVTDVGEQVNPVGVEGQVHGGVAQGVGQALYEDVVYDDNGNLLSGSFQDYTLPKAEHVPEMRTDSTVTPCPHNPLGAKGVGESPAIAAPPAVANAVLDALEPLGVETLDMPITEETVWRAVRDAE